MIDTLEGLFLRRYGRKPYGVDGWAVVKGEDVYSAGRVKRHAAGDDGTLTGLVGGSNDETYTTTARLVSHGQRLSIESGCSCPVGRDCKHGIALVMAWLAGEADVDAGEPFEEAPAIRMPAGAPRGRGTAVAAETAKGLSRAMEWVTAMPAEAASARRPAPAPIHRLLYSLEVSGNVPVLQVWKVRMLRSGQAAGAPEPYTNLLRAVGNVPSFWDETDEAVALALWRDKVEPWAIIVLEGERSAEVVQLLASSGKLYTDDPDAKGAAPVRRGSPRPAELAWAPHEDRVRLTLVPSPAAHPLLFDPPWYLDATAGEVGPLDTTLSPAMAAWLRDAPELSPFELAFTRQELANRIARAPTGRVPLPPAVAVEERQSPPVPCLRLRVLKAERTDFRAWYRRDPPVARFSIDFGVRYGGVLATLSKPLPVIAGTAESRTILVRDPQAEQAAWELLAREVLVAAHLRLRPSGDTGPYELVEPVWHRAATIEADTPAALAIVHRVKPALERAGWQVTLEGRLPLEVQEADAWSAELADAPKSGNDWFELKLGVTVDGKRIDLAGLLADILRHGGFAAWKTQVVRDGDAYLMPIGPKKLLRLPLDRIEPLVDTVVDWVGEREGDPRLREPRVPLLAAALTAADWAARGITAALPDRVDRLATDLRTFDGVAEAAPARLVPTPLRPYQRHGVGWLQFLRAHGFGGVLADDMGLGKTLQVLAHIAIEKEQGRLALPALVIAPTSVAVNWQAEVLRHAPKLSVLALTGANRSAHFGAIGRHDIVLSTYALLSRDAEVLTAQPWSMVVADEAQWAKNARTQAARVLRALQAPHRLALTGTPLENHLGELHSIVDFAMPGLLGDEKSFRRHFRTPIERRGDAEDAESRRVALRRRLKPFLLRRAKAEVATELPPKTEIVRSVELAKDQRDLYETVRSSMDARVRKALAEAGLAKSHIVLLDALLKLRQVCCDPSLVRLPAAARVKGSAKLDLLTELLATLHDEGRRVLLFSQFTSMLDRIERALDADTVLRAIPRVRLDGDTKDRSAPVQTFQRGDAHLFLLSLKAGGAGLNLTAADVVIHYDPWWNPAVENQATDRAHRIGQDKPVFVYKLVTTGTVEEKIVALQGRKAALAAALLTEDAAALGKSLTAEDLQVLFEPLPGAA